MTDRSMHSTETPAPGPDGAPSGEPDGQSGGIGIVADGWWNLADTASYYPEDLPAEWRLGYFANEYEGAYVDLAHWCAGRAGSLRDWAADVHPGFRFYLQEPTSAGLADADAAVPTSRAISDLGPHLGGFIRWTDADSGRVLTPADPHAGAGAWRETATVLRGPRETLGDLRAAGTWLRRIASRRAATLVILPTPSSSQLARWQDLKALLGIGPLTIPDEATE